MIMIIINHCPWEADERLKYLFPFYITMAVPGLMFISGYLNAQSFKRNNIKCFSDCYQRSFIFPRLMRLIIPFTIIFLAEITIHILFSSKKIYEYLLMYLSGGWGDGTYYFPVMIQFVFIFPFIFFPIKNKGINGVLIFFGATLFYELLQRAFQMNVECYTNIFFRYTFLTACGCYCGLYSGVEKTWNLLCVLMIAIGFAFVILFNYTGYQTVIFQNYWKNTTVLPTLFVIPFVAFIIRKANWRFTPLELIGKASYHVFLIQKVFFYGMKSGFASLMVENRGLQIIMSVVICLTVGIAFYFAETFVRKRIKE